MSFETQLRNSSKLMATLLDIVEGANLHASDVAIITIALKKTNDWYSSQDETRKSQIEETAFNLINSPAFPALVQTFGLLAIVSLIGSKAAPFFANLLDTLTMFTDLGAEAIAEGVNEATTPISSALARDSVDAIADNELLRTGFNWSDCDNTNYTNYRIRSFAWWLDNEKKGRVAFKKHGQRLDMYLGEHVIPQLEKIVDHVASGNPILILPQRIANLERLYDLAPSYQTSQMPLVVMQDCP